MLHGGIGGQLDGMDERVNAAALWVVGIYARDSDRLDAVSTGNGGVDKTLNINGIVPHLLGGNRCPRETTEYQQ